MDYFIPIFLYGLLCAGVGIWASEKANEDYEKSVENLLQAHREYEESLKRGYEYFKKVAADQEEIISQLTGGSYDNR